MRKFARTISGVTPVAVMARPMACPGNCVYCPDYSETPRSYTPESPAVLRAIRCGYDAREQVSFRLRIFAEMGHPIDKVELIIMGGTFLAQSVEYQYEFIQGCYEGLNGADAPNLAEARKINESTANRCVGLCIETRPDWCGEAEVPRMLEFGATRVEMGVQTLDDGIYQLVKRGHGVDAVRQATKLLKDQAFKVYYHWMPGLPGLTPEGDITLFNKLFSDPDFRPDGLKIYPTVVVEGSELDKWRKDGRYTPYDEPTMLKLIGDMKERVPPYVRIPRVLRDIPARYIMAGCRDSLRDTVKNRMREKGIACQCIRCREYGHRLRAGYVPGEPELKRLDYEASGGLEIFLSYEDAQNTLFGLLRLRIQAVPPPLGWPIDGRAGMVRELHVFGPEVPISARLDAATQHRGLGKALLAEAERITREEFGIACIAVLAGTGSREYYRGEPGYTIKGEYMVKELPVGVKA
ncbi:elongator complex protein 3 [Chloroflexota bacterium]